MELYIRLEPPFEWVRVDGRKIEAFGEVPKLGDYPLDENYDVIGVVPGGCVTSHRVSLPAKSRKQFQAAVPYALEETLSEDVEKLVFICHDWQAGEATVVYVVSKDRMRQWQAIANEFALPVSRLVPEYALIPLHGAADYTLVAQPERFLTHERDGSGISLDLEFIDSWVADVPMSSTIAVNKDDLTEKLIAQYPDRDFRHWPIGDRMAHWLEYAPARSVDLWAEQFRPRVANLSWRAFSEPVAAVAAAILLVLVFDTYRYFSLHHEVRSIDRQMRELVLSTFPEFDDVQRDNELVIMEQALARRGGAVQSGGMNQLLAETARVLRRQNVTLMEMSFRDDQLVISCNLTDFSQVDEIRRQLNARPRISANLESSASADGKIIASYVVRHG